jgi:hypothetical protein
MTLYVLVPYSAESQEEFRFFTSFGVAEQIIFRAAKDYASKGQDPNWCVLFAYDGTDELLPVYLYTLVAPDRLHRERIPSPSP